MKSRNVGLLVHLVSMSEPDSATPTTSPLRRFVDRHLALLGAVLLIVIATFRVYFVAGFDLPTALAVLAIVDRTQLLTSSVLTALVFVLPVLFIQPAVRRWLLAGNAAGATFPTQLRTGLLFFPLVMIVLATFTLPLLGGWLVGWLMYVVLSRWARRRAIRVGAEPPKKNAPLFDSNFNNWILATLLGWMFLTALIQPWLVREVVELSDGEQVVGSVVGTQGEMTLLLLPRDGAQWVATGEIETRSVCRDSPEWYSLTVFALVPRDGISCKAILEEQLEG